MFISFLRVCLLSILILLSQSIALEAQDITIAGPTGAVSLMNKPLTASDTVRKEALAPCTYIISYILEHQPVSGDPSSLVTCPQELRLGAHTQWYGHRDRPRSDSILDAMARAGKTFGESYHARKPYLQAQAIREILFHDETKGILELRDDIFTDYYRYTEPIEGQAWQLSTGDSVVAGYKCHRAVCSWRGRNYVAWYSEELPLSYGPYKFRGLPGLIVCIYDTKGDYRYTLTGLRQAAPGEYLYLVPRKRIYDVKRTALSKMKQHEAEHPGSYQTARIIARTGVASKQKARPYNPIELE